MSEQFIGTAPYFVVADLKRSLAYYHEKLGFDEPEIWGDPPEFAMPSREGFIFMIRAASNGREIVVNRKQGGTWDAYIWIRDAQSLFEEFESRGAQIEYRPTIQKEYDMKEFAVRDPDGYVIAFGQHYEVSE